MIVRYHTYRNAKRVEGDILGHYPRLVLVNVGNIVENRYCTHNITPKQERPDIEFRKGIIVVTTPPPFPTGILSLQISKVASDIPRHHQNTEGNVQRKHSKGNRIQDIKDTVVVLVTP
jgi:hypothetical protein